MAQPNLTTPANVKRYLRDPVGNADEVIDSLIDTASRMVRQVTGRHFTSPRALGVTREFRPYDTSFVYVDEVFSAADILNVTDGDGNVLNYDADFDMTDPFIKGCDLEVQTLGSYWTSGGYLAVPPDHSTLFVTELNMASGITSRYPQKVLVTGNFGYAAIPPDVEFATRQAVAVWFREDVARYTADTFISRGRMFEPEALPPLTMSKLERSGWVIQEPVMA